MDRIIYHSIQPYLLSYPKLLLTYLATAYVSFQKPVDPEFTISCLSIPNKTCD